MKKIGENIKTVLVLSCMIILPTWVIAQGTPPVFGGDGDQVIDVAVPFDGGLSLLVAAGIGYGVKKARDRKKAEKVKQNIL